MQKSVEKKNKIFSIRMLMLGGYPGLMLMGRSVVQLFFTRGRALDEYATVDTSAMVFILYAFGAFFISLRYLFTKDWPFLKKVLFRSPVQWFVYYTALCFISTLWSVDPQLTGFRAFECLSMLLLIATTITQLYRNCRQTDAVIQWSLLYTFFSIIVALIIRARWDHGLGLFQASQMVATVFFYMAVFHSRSLLIRWTVILFSILSFSTTAYLGMAFGMAGLLFTKMKYRFVIFFCAIAAGIAVSYIGVDTVLKNTIFINHPEAVGGDLDDILEDSSGRNHVWEAALESTAETPWGYGFFSGEPYILYSRNLGGINAHNSFLSALMGVGPLGMLFLACYFLFFGPILLSRYIPNQYRPALIGCFFVGMAHSMGNPGIGSRVYGSWLPVTYILVLIVCIYLYHKYIANRSHP